MPMTYQRPTSVWLPPEYDDKAKNLHARMALYFDLFVYKPEGERNDTLLYQYLYHIIYMLACKQNFFKSIDEYDNFSLYMATKVYLRYINPKHQGPEDRIVSVLNYCKGLLYPTKVDFLKETYVEILGSNPNKNEDFSLLHQSMSDGIQSDHINNDMILQDVIEEFEALPKLIRLELNKVPYTRDKLMMHRLFMSVLLTIINGVTLSNSAIDKLGRRVARGLEAEEFKLNLLLKERDSSVILWRLENKYYNLVNLLARKVRKKCGENVGLVRQDYELSNEDVAAVLASAYGNVARDDNEEF